MLDQVIGIPDDMLDQMVLLLILFVRLSQMICQITLFLLLLLTLLTSQQNVNITNKSLLMQIVAENDHVAVMFYEKGDERSEK